MYIIIETATSRGLVALVSEGKVLASEELLLGLGNSRQLEPALDHVMKKAGLLPQQLQFIAVGRGPGSYTGMRVGVASAKGLAIALKIPLVALYSLRGFIPPTDYEGTFCAALDAKIGGVYFIEGKMEGGRAEFQGSEMMLSIADFQQKLKSIGCLVTPAWKPLEARLGSNYSNRVIESGPSVDAYARQAEMLFSEKKYTLDGSCELLYLRLTQAEMEKLPNKAQLG